MRTNFQNGGLKPGQVHLAVNSLNSCPDAEQLGRAHHDGCSRQGTGLLGENRPFSLMLLKPESSSVLPLEEAQRCNRLVTA